MPQSPGRARRLSLLAALYVAQAVPLGFIVEALPAIGRTFGLSLGQIGMIQAVALPFMLKFLWAPIVDGCGLDRLGHYRSWLIPLQSLSVCGVIVASMLDPTRHGALLIGLAALFMTIAATQDIATDGLAVRTLAPSERGMGNGIQVGGYFFGQILGGGLMLVLFERVGWRATMGAMALLLAPPLVVLARYREAEGPPRRIAFASLARFFRRAGALPWVLILLIYRAGDAMAMVMLKPLLVDRGWSLSSIGLLLGVGNASGAMVGALIGGWLVHRWGRRRSLTVLPLLQAAALAALAGVDGWADQRALVWIVSITASLCGGMATSALYTAMMDRSEQESAGTDFTIQQSLAVIGPLVAAGLSGTSVATLGYSPHFVVAGAIALVAATAAAWGMRK